jgi:hypothetical protein
MLYARFGLGSVIGAALFALTSGSVIPASAQTTTLAATSAYAGTYTGTAQPVPGNDPSCDPGGHVTLAVQDGRFRLPWREPQAFDVRISPDGSFYATSGSVLAQSDKHMMLVPTLQGRVSSTGLQATYGTRWCRYELEAMHS